MIRNRDGTRCAWLMAMVTCAACAFHPMPGAQAKDTTGQEAARSVTEKPAGDKYDKNGEVQKKLERPIQQIDLEGVAFSEILEFIRDNAGINMYANWKQLEKAGIDRNATVSLKRRNVAASEALRDVLAQADKKGRLRYVIDSDVVEIQLAGAPARPADLTAVKTPDKEMQALLDRTIPEVNFEGTALSDAVNFEGAVTGSNIVVDWKSLERAGIDRDSATTVKLRNVKFSKALSLTFEDTTATPVKLIYKIDKGTISISAPPPLPALH